MKHKKYLWGFITKGNWYYECQILMFVFMWKHDMTHENRGIDLLRIGRFVVWIDTAWKWKHIIPKKIRRLIDKALDASYIRLRVSLAESRSKYEAYKLSSSILSVKIAFLLLAIGVYECLDPIQKLYVTLKDIEEK